MIRPKLPLRRPLAIIGAVVIGLGAALSVAAPASAHHPEIKGTVVCPPGSNEKVITWTISHSERDKTATILGITSTPDTDVTTAEGKVLARIGQDGNADTAQPVLRKKGKDGDSITVEQKVPGTTTGFAKMRMSMKWSKDGKTVLELTTNDSQDGKVNLGNKTCGEQPPVCVDAAKAQFKHTFDGPGGKATVELEGNLPLCGEGSQPFTLVSYFAPRPQFDVPQYLFAQDTDVIKAGTTKIDLQVEVPDCNTQVDLIWGDESEIIKEIVEGGARYGNKKLGSPGAPGNRSKGPAGWYNGGTKACQQPAADFVSSCDGSVAVKLSNDGKTSKYPVEFTITAGEWVKKVKVEAGAGDTVEVPAEHAAEIVVTADGFETKKGGWQRPEDCELPEVLVHADCETYAVGVLNPEGNTPLKAEVTYAGETKTVSVPAGNKEPVVVTFEAGDATTATIVFPELDLEPLEATFEKPANCGGGGGGEEPGLPVTGAAAGGIAAGALALLGLGVFLFIMARRRRVTFTA
ncbi:cell wall anchor protein [Micromonospora sp. WMMD1102]|uniref:cell wall anchor protein n=1 Tax=Micromonospora sp. WMMD1102 TaxID=3016105 RepID=UPI0024154870|nr:cell wall anchor protein [Micromonospora sp. WMMD1102]MDG4785538.1 cell wall anchor protein [Micromonospora sp. WMMD1102]